MLMEEQRLPPEFADNLYDNVFRIWANPEIERRKAAGEVPEDYKPWAVQVYMEPTIPNQVRFDEEVNGVFHTAPTSGLPSGEEIGPLNFHKIAKKVVAIELSDDDSADAGYITIVRHKEGFYISFDFHYNSARIADHIRTAREFSAARSSRLITGSRECSSRTSITPLSYRRSHRYSSVGTRA